MTKPFPPKYSIGMCSTTDQSLIDETFKFILSEARSQDIYVFFAILAGPEPTRRQMAQFTKDNFDEIYNRFSTNIQLQRLISVSFQ